MRHLWTVVTSADTFTHDAGAPEWLDIPGSEYLVPSPNGETNAMEVPLDPIWYVASTWVVDEDDIGRQLFIVVRYFDPGNRMLYAAPLERRNGEVHFSPEPGMDGTYIPLTVQFPSIWYTEPGRYTFEVQCLDSLATLELGRFSVMLTHLNGGGDNE